MNKIRWFGLWITAAILLIGAGRCVAQEAVKPSDPSPPVLKDARWQYLDRKYQDVFIDGSGRAWFLIREYPSTAGGKRPGKFLSCPQAPDDYIEIPGENHLIGFDSKDRFWEVGKYGLCCTEVRTGKFVQREPAPGVDLSPWRSNGANWRPTFGPAMLEHSSGRIYFVDSLGVHVLDGDRWSYELLLPPGKNWVIADSDWSSVKMVEGPDGRVFVWLPGEYLNTVFIHDGSSWKRFPAKDYPLLDRAEGIAPEKDGWVGVYRQYGPSTRVKLYDAVTPVRAPAAASRPSVKRYEADLLANAGEELSLYGSALGRDREGRVYFSASGQEIFSGFERIAVMDARRPAGEPTLKYQSIGLHRTTDYRAIAVDSKGGIWARLAVEEHPFLSRYFQGKWTHYPDPSPAPAGEIKGTLTQYGNPWVIQPPSAGPTWRPDWKNDLRGVPAMANPGLLLALKNGCMIAAEDFNRRAFLFDAQGWHAYESLKALVEARYDWLKGNLDNRGMAWRRLTFLGLDATGRIWVSSGDRYGFGGAYDGTRWQDIPKDPLELNAAGDRCVCREFLLDTSAWPPKELASTKSGNDARLGGRLRVDNQGRFVSTDPFKAESYTPLSSARRPGFVYGICKTAEGPVSWVCYSTLDNTPFYNLQAIWPDGARSKPYRHPFRMDRLVAHQGADVYWAAAGDGMLRLRLEGKGDQAQIKLDKLYPRIIPQGAVTWMAVGADGALWMATQFGKSGLYRIEIPPVTEGRP